MARQGPEPEVPRPASGDTVNLAIWASKINLLLAPPEPRAGSVMTLDVSADGTIFVPHIETVPPAGPTPEAARTDIQNRLKPIAPSAQVQLDVALAARRDLLA